MSRPVSPIVCDGPGCTKQKQESNRWWTVHVSTIHELGQPEQVSRIEVFPGTSTRPVRKQSSLYDFCGQTCALKFLSEQMSKVTS